MKQLFTGRNDMEAHFVKGLLEQEGITAILQGEALEGAWADLPLSDRALPSIWVDEADLERAQPIIDDYRQREMKTANQPDDADESTGPTWKCPKCGEEVDEQFDVCWNCETEKPGLAAG
ncbi:MAG TPA: DUF2007 domain-containing protein [Tepidisphaeraceae bacterium]|jgi:hypothetical protein|nr:DUF2007 domain-containing protein [Tepidisphaeraceae bacterium]